MSRISTLLDEKDAPVETPKQDRAPIAMEGQLMFKRDIGLIFMSTNAQGESVTIVIPADKKTLLDIINAENESINCSMTESTVRL